MSQTKKIIIPDSIKREKEIRFNIFFFITLSNLRYRVRKKNRTFAIFFDFFEKNFVKIFQKTSFLGVKNAEKHESGVKKFF